MNKRELIHLHGLLFEVARYCETTGDGRVDLRRYRTLGTRPTSVHHPKADHREALFALVRATSRFTCEGSETTDAAGDSPPSDGVDDGERRQSGPPL